MEIERKFLVRTLPDLTSAESVGLRQGYLATGRDGQVRLRDSDGSLTLTFKSGEGMVREEIETPVTVAQFEALWPATRDRRLEKRRYRVPLGGVTGEIDVYEGGLTGLLVVEVEFPSIDDARSFVAPDWFGRDVTDDPAYGNTSLACRGLPVT
jgi:CYTH domain-containing protein